MFCIALFRSILPEFTVQLTVQEAVYRGQHLRPQTPQLQAHRLRVEDSRAADPSYEICARRRRGPHFTTSLSSPPAAARRLAAN